MTTPSTVAVHVTRRFAVAAERVFDAWLDADLIARWMFGPDVRDEAIVRIQLDARVGGRFSFVVRRGADEIDHVGTYLAVERPRHLAFTWAIAPEDGDPSRVTIDVAPDGDGCVLTLTHEMPARWAEYASRTEAGWTTMLGAMQRTLDTGDFGVVAAPDAVRFERLLPAPIERVWTFLTDADARGTWFASGDMELRVGGRVTLHFRHANLSSPDETPPARFADMATSGHTMLGRVTRCEPPHLLSFTWGDEEPLSEVTFELSPHAGGTRLVLTHRRLGTHDEMVDVAGGWHTHLTILAARLEGRTPRGIWTLLAGLDGVYGRRLAPK